MDPRDQKNYWIRKTGKKHLVFFHKHVSPVSALLFYDTGCLPVGLTSPELHLLRDGAADALVAHHQLLQLVPEQPVKHGVEALQLGEPEQVPLELVVQRGAGLEAGLEKTPVI
jgi:hypothetical protein